jgi:hypothetical protein
LSYDENSDGSTRTIQDFIEDFVDVPEGGINWRVLGQTKEITKQTKTPDGFDMEYLKPEFSDAVKALDGKEVKIRGFMFPLGEVEAQNLFLFGPFPISCPFHYHVGPSLVLEVHADENPVTFTYDAITLTGVLELVPDDPENNTFYRLKNARLQ